MQFDLHAARLQECFGEAHIVRGLQSSILTKVHADTRVENSLLLIVRPTYPCSPRPSPVQSSPRGSDKFYSAQTCPDTSPGPPSPLSPRGDSLELLLTLRHEPRTRHCGPSPHRLVLPPLPLSRPLPRPFPPDHFPHLVSIFLFPLFPPVPHSLPSSHPFPPSPRHSHPTLTSLTPVPSLAFNPSLYPHAPLPPYLHPTPPRPHTASQSSPSSRALASSFRSFSSASRATSYRERHAMKYPMTYMSTAPAFTAAAIPCSVYLQRERNPT